MAVFSVEVDVVSFSVVFAAVFDVVLAVVFSATFDVVFEVCWGLEAAILLGSL